MVAESNERKSGEVPTPASAELIGACQRGDYDAFSALFESCKDRVYSIALRFSGDPAAAADITQDIFLKLLAQIQAFRGEARFETWLYRVVVNACLDHQRARRRWLPLLEDVLGSIVNKVRSAEPLRSAERAQVRDRVARAIAALPAEQRIVVVLRYTEGLSYEEITEATGFALGTVASRLNRAHKALEGQLQDLRPKGEQ